MGARRSALDRWNELYHAITARNGAEADAGRYLLGWAQAAGFTDVQAGSSTWTFADADRRAWWGSLWADRVELSSFADQALEYGLSDRAELADLAGRVADLGRTARRLLRGPPRRDPRHPVIRDAGHGERKDERAIR